MRSRYSALLWIALLSAPGLLAQSSSDQLPDSPSAVANKPKPAPPKPKPAGTKPAEAKPAAAAPAAQAQPPVEKPAAVKNDVPDDATAETIRINPSEVSVIFTVTDKHGRFITNLTQNDISVLDNKEPPKSISSFRSETNLPLRVGLLIDTSTSIRERFRFEQESAVEFLADIVRPKVDLAFVMGFDTTIQVDPDFTNDTGLLAQGVHDLRPGGGTALFDALYTACRDKLLKHPERGAVRRAVILISDGDDNQSHATREEAIDMAQRADVIVYAISTNTTRSNKEGDQVLSRIAESTGGRAYFPFKMEDVANAFLEVREELRSQYALAYKPANLGNDGRFHTIEIAAHKGMRVRARKGYYAPSR